MFSRRNLMIGCLATMAGTLLAAQTCSAKQMSM